MNFYTFSKIALACLTLTPSALASSGPSQINFGIACIIHDSKGTLLKDLGMVGAGMDGGAYIPTANFDYRDFKIQASLNGALQLELTVYNARGDVAASLITYADPSIDVALFVPHENVYIQCDKMEM